jgi:hypothetical protein
MKTFQSLDLNNDGMLSREELILGIFCFSALGYSKLMPFAEAEEQVDKIMSTVDKNHSNAIDYTGTSSTNQRRIRDGLYEPRVIVAKAATRDRFQDVRHGTFLRLSRITAV